MGVDNTVTRSTDARDRALLSCFVIGDGTLTTQCCELLVGRGHDIACLVTSNGDIADWAAANGIAVRDAASAFLSDEFEAVDYLFSIANTQMLPAAVAARARHGAINFHDGPLPRYAGLHATSWALMNRERHHGVSWHMIADRVDAGDVLEQAMVELDGTETAFILNTLTFNAGLQSFSRLVKKLETGTVKPKAQDFSKRSYFGRFKRPANAAIVSWQADAKDIDALVRALDFGSVPNPLGRPKLRIGKDFLICARTALVEAPAEAAPGTVFELSDQAISVATGKGGLEILSLLDLSGSALELAEVIARYDISKGATLPELPSESLEVIAATAADVCKSEDAWVADLQRLAPVKIPFLSNPESGPADVGTFECETMGLPGPMTADEPPCERRHRLVAAFAAFISRLGEEKAFDVGLRHSLPGACTGLFAPVVPLRFEVDGAASLASQSKELVDVVTSTLARRTFLNDALSRYPELAHLKGQALARHLDVQIELVESLGDESDDADFTLRVVVPRQGGRWRWKFDNRVLNADSVARMSRQFRTFLDSVATEPEKPIGEHSILNESEVSQLLQLWSHRHVELLDGPTVHGAFEAQVAKTPSAIAIVCRGQQLTYAELNARANTLARRLGAQGVVPDSLVGIFTNRSVEMIVGMLAILKAGGAYVPLDPSYPPERVAYILEDSNAAVVLTQTTLLATLPVTPAKIVLIDAGPGTDLPRDEGNLPGVATASNLAYTIYTSGSTGKPKGVMVEHGNVMNFFAGMDRVIDVGPDPVWLAVTSISFDISVLEIFWTLARGFKVVVYTRDEFEHTEAVLPADDRAIDFSLFYFSAGDGEDPANKYRLLLEGAKFADDHGFKAIWTPERHFHAFGGLYPNPAVTGAALAVATENLQIRSGSVVAPLHSPIRIAEEWAVVDNLSGGRVGVSFASGWMPEDFVIKPENYENRKAVMFETIDTVRRLWRGEEAEFPPVVDGKDVIKIRTQPRPLQDELPVWVTTAGTPETYVMAAKAGANILTHLLGQSIEEVARNVQLYRTAWQEAGHAGRGSVSLMLHTFVGESQDEVMATVRQPLKDYLRSSASLIKQYAWSFPTFSGAETSAKDVDLETLGEEQMDAILDFAVDRYSRTSGLFGTPESCARMIADLKANDIDEVACLIDFGPDTERVLTGLPYLNELRELSTVSASVRDPLSGAAESDSVAELIRRHQVTHLQCTPSTVRVLMMDAEFAAAARGLRECMIGGEAFPPPLARELCDVVGGNVINMYGPTETTIWSSTHKLDQVGETVPIGSPIANTELVVVDDKMRPVPLGTPGELLIGGKGVVRGYHGQPELTAQRFIPDPFNGDRAGRLYRTGDLVQSHDDGSIEFIGRMDHQVKVRGHRIELGEIEARLREHPAVSDAVAIVREDRPGDKRIAAYWLSRDGHIPDAGELRRHVARDLPSYMVPSHVVRLKAFPLTPNNKIDRNALPPPNEVQDASVGPRDLPANAVESQLAELWKEILETSHVGRDDNFFELGGHSLSAVQLVANIERTYAVTLPLRAFLAKPDLGSVAQRVTELLQQAHGSERAEPKSASQREPRQADQPAIQVPPQPTVKPKNRTWLSGTKNRLLQLLALYAPGLSSLRPWLHRQRGVAMGSNVSLGMGVILETAKPHLIKLGSNIEIGIRTVVIGHFRDMADSAGRDGPSVLIEDDVFIGPNVTILPNVTIGANAVVAAGSVVNTSVPPNTLVQGNPAVPVARCKVSLIGNTYTRFAENLEPLAGVQSSDAPAIAKGTGQRPADASGTVAAPASQATVTTVAD